MKISTPTQKSYSNTKRVLGLIRVMAVLSMLIAPLMPSRSQLGALAELGPKTAAAQTGAPGGVSSGLGLWLKANTGTSTTTENADVSSWSDSSPAANNVIQSVAARRPNYIGNGANFNPALDFVGNEVLIADNKGNLSIPNQTDPNTLISVSTNRTTGGSWKTTISFGGALDYPSQHWFNDIPNTYIDGVGGTLNMSHFDSIAIDTPTIINSRANNANPKNVRISYNGALNTRTYADAPLNGTFPASGNSNDLTIGAETDSAGSENLNGLFTEGIVYNRNLSDVELVQVNSYLAIKYGITMTSTNYIASDGTTIFWNSVTNLGYNNNIAGLSRDDGSALVQKQSKSVNSGFQPVIALGAIAATNAANGNTFAADKNAIVWGSNNLSATFGTAYTPTSYSPTTGYFRMNRMWKVQETGTVGSVQVQGPANAKHLLVSAFPTFPPGATSEIPLTNSSATFNFADGEYFTFGAEATAPGGVAGNMSAWWKANQGAEAGGSAPANNASVDTWLDQGLENNDAFQNSGTLKPEWVENNGKFNFNPSLNFNPNARMQAELSTASWNNNDGTAYVIYNQEVDGAWRNLVDFGLTASDSNDPQLGMTPADVIGSYDDCCGQDNSIFPVVNNETHLAGYDWTFNTNGAVTYYFDGRSDAGGATHRFGPVMGNFANIGGDPQLGEYMNGQIAEIVLYKEKHNAATRQRVQSYMAVKYGVTITATNYIASDGTTTIWSLVTNTGYSNNIAGIGRDDAAALNQKQSKSVNSGFQPVIGLGTIAATNALNSSTFAANKNFMVWGSNTAATTFGTVYTPTFPVSTGYFRMNRVWRVQETGTVDNVQVRGPDAADYLLVSNDPTFATGVTEVPLADDGNGNQVATHNFANGNYFTFGAPQTAPGGYAAGLTLWARSTDGTSCTTGNCNITDWDDFSGNGNHMTEFGLSAGTTFKAADPSFNFHPYVEATGGNVGFGKTALNMGNGPRTVCVVHGARTSQIYSTIAQFGPFDDPWMGYTSLSQTKWDDYVWAALDTVANTITLNLPALSCYSWTPGSKMSMGTNGKWLLSAQGTHVTAGVSFYLGYDQDAAGVADTNFGEVAVYQGTYTATGMAQIQSYFALRYGITLDQSTPTDYVASDGSTKTWTASANTGYNNDIAGIGRDDASALEQLQSKSENTDDIVTMGVGPITTTNVANTGVFTANKSYLVWSNNNGIASTTTALITGTCAPPGLTDKRINRTWKVQETGGIGSVYVQAALSAGFNISMPVYMLVGTDPTFATYTSVPMTRNSNGTYDTNYNFASGQFFTFAGNTTAPANICTDGDKYINWWNEGWNYGQKTKVITKGSQTFTFTISDPGNVTYVTQFYPLRLGDRIYIPRYDNNSAAAIQFKMQMSRPAVSVEFDVCDLDGWYAIKDKATFTGFLSGSSVGNPTLTKGADFYSVNYGMTFPSANSAQGDRYLWGCLNPGKVHIHFKQPVDEVRMDFTTVRNYNFNLFADLSVKGIDVQCASPPPPPTPDNIYLSKRAPQGINPVDEAQTFSFEVQNLTCNAKTVNVADTLPSGLTYVGDSLSTNLTPTVNAYSGTASLNLTNLTVPPGKHTFAIDVIGTVSNTYLNQAGVTVNGNTYLSDDPRQSGGSDATPLQLVTNPEPVANIQIGKSANVSSAKQNSVITYTFQFTNNEASPVAVIFQDVLDGQMYFMTSTLTNPNGGTPNAYGGQTALSVFTMTLPVGSSTASVQVNTGNTDVNTTTVNVASIMPMQSSGYSSKRVTSNPANVLISAPITGTSILVNTTADNVTAGDGNCTLREAITNSNANSDTTGGDCLAGSAAITDTIAFSITGAGPHIIQPTSALPLLNGNVKIDGETQPGASCGPTRNLLIALSGASAGSVDGLATVTGAANFTIRGMAIYSFTTKAAIYIDGGATNGVNTNAVIECNNIGTDITGLLKRSNDTGVSLWGANNNRVGTNGDGVNDASERNIIVGNTNRGIDNEFYSSNNVIAGNYFGLGADGSTVIANGDGVFIAGSAKNNLVGTNGDGVNDANERNVISGNGTGVSIGGGNVMTNVVAGNYIGTDATGALARGNTGYGVSIYAGPTNNRIGGNGATQSNLIAFNSAGVVVETPSTNNAILGNSIYSNTNLGIDLGANGVTANDVGDGDTGPNGLLNFPVIQSVSGTTVNLNSDVPAGNYLLQIYDNPLGKDPTGYGEGQTLVYSGTVAITSGGMNHSATLASAPSNSGQRLAATLTQDLGSGSYGSTSEFGNQVVTALPDLTTTIGQPSPAFMAGASSNVPITVTNAVTAGTTTGPITTTMTLPNANFSAPASFSSNGNTCTTAGLTVTCVNPGSIAAGGSNVIQVPVTPNVSAVGTAPAFNGTTATPGETNTSNNAAAPMTPSPAVVAAACLQSNGTVTSNETDTDPSDNTASICVPISTAAPDLTTAIGQPSPHFVAGQISSVPMTVTNAGTAATTSTITSTMTLPANFSAPATFSNGGWNCTTTGQVVNCSNSGPISATTSSAVQVPVTPSAAAVGSTPAFNGSSGTPGESNTSNNAAPAMTPSAAVVAAPAPDLTTTIGQPSPNFVSGSPSNIPVTVTNSGTAPTTEPVTTTMTLPAGMSAPATFSNNGWTCATSGQTVTCTNPSPIANGGNSFFTVPATPNASTIGSTPTFSATTAPTAGETVTANNGPASMTPATAVVAGPTPDLTTTVGQPSPAFVAGSPSNVPMTVTNAGTGPTTGPITSTMTLPAGTTAPASFGNGGWSCTTSGQTVTCSNPGPIANGSSSTVQVPVTPDNTTVGTQPVINATTQPTAGETNTSNNAAAPMTPTTAVVAAPAPDLTTTIGQPAPAFVAGTASNVPITVSNVGNAPATGPLTTTMNLPIGTSAPASFNSGTWNCTTTGSTVTCVNPNPLAAASSSTIQVPVTANVSTVGTTPGPFTGSTAPAPGETNTGNNASPNMTPTTAVAPAPVPPVAPTINNPTNGSSITNTQPAIGGIGTPGALITVTESPTGTVLCSTTVGANSLWSCTPSTPLPQGSHTVSAVASNGNGSSPASAPVTFTVDNTAPAAPAITAPTASSTVNDNTPLFSGTGEPGSTVVVKEGTTTICTAVVDGTGNWACSPATVMPEGAHTVTATQTDPAGNVSPASPARSFTVATAPDLTTTIGNPQPALQATVPSTLPVTVNNVGVAPTSGPVTTTVALPPGVTAPANFTSGPWTCTATQPPDAFTASTATCTSSTPIPAGGSSTINVPVTPDPARVGSTPTFNATSAGGGEANTSNNAATPLTSSAVLPASRVLPIKVFLHGPFSAATGIMSDGLRVRNMVPLTEPYAALGFARAGSGGETTTAGVLAVSGSSAVVDWVLVELRDSANPATLIKTKAALLLRNGFVKDVDGTSDLSFTGLTQSSYFVSVRHRNHLGVMTIAPVTLSASTPLQDFTTMTAGQVHGSNARRAVGSIYTLWAGNANSDSKVQAAGASNDLSAISSLVLNPANGNNSLVRNWKVAGYRSTDVNMDGDTIASGANNDIAVVVNNVTTNPINQPALNRNTTVDQRLP